jgi:hypothetical protein
MTLSKPLDAHPVQPRVPEAATMLPPSRRQAGLRGGVAAVLFVGAVTNVVASRSFPAADVEGTEQYFALLTSGYVLAAAVVLAIFAMLAAIGRSVPVRPGSLSPLSVAGLVLSVLAGLAWLLLCVLPTLGELADTGRFEYLTLVGLVVVFAAPWLLGIIFSTLGFRSGGPRTARFAGTGLGIGLVILLTVVGASVLFATGFLSLGA